MRKQLSGMKMVCVGHWHRVDPPVVCVYKSFFLTVCLGLLFLFSSLSCFTASAYAAPPGLVAWWPGNGNADDIAGGHQGTFAAGTYAPGISGQAFSFDGVDDYVGVGMLGAVGAHETAPFTVSAWINCEDTAPNQAVVGNYMGEQVPPYVFFSTYMTVNAGNLMFGLNVRQSYDINISTPITSGWHYVTGSYDGSDIALYVDGQLKGTAARNFSGSTDNTRGWYIGNHSPETNSSHLFQSSFHGLIDEVQIFDRALTAPEITAGYGSGLAGHNKPCVQAPAGLVAWWTGDNTALDIVGTSNGLRHGNSGYAVDDGHQAFSFDGVADYLEITRSALLEPSTITVEFWVKQNGEPALYTPYVAKTRADGPYGGFLFNEYFGNRMTFQANISGNWTYLFGNTSLTPGIWHHIAGTYDGTNLRLYVNGALDGAVYAPGSLSYADTATNIRIANSGDTPTLFFNGLVDEVSIYDRALSDTEITAIYGTGSAGKCKDCFTPPSGLVSWWPGDGDPTDMAGPNSGTFTAGTYASGEIGQAFSFDGVNDSVSVPDSASLQALSTAFSVEAWVNPAALPAVDPYYDTAIVREESLSGFALVTKANRFGLWIGTGGGLGVLATGLPAVPGNWYHVAGTYDGSNARLYVNGELQGIQPAAMLTMNKALNIGSCRGTGRFFNGLLDEVRVYSRALTSDEIRGISRSGLGVCKSCFMPQNGLVSRWRAEGDSKDARGINNGSAHAEFLAMALGQAFNFAGTGDYVTMTDTGFPAGNSPRTVDFWFSTSDDLSERYMFSYGSAGAGQRFSVGLYSGYLHIENNGSGLHGSTLLNSAGSHHAAATWDGSALNVYVDGSKEALTSVASPWPAILETAPTGQASLGQLNSGGYYYTGLLDEAGIYSRALTADEIAWRYSCSADSNPDPYALASQSGIYPGAAGSSSFVVTGINMPLSIRISGIPPSGYFGINGGDCNLQDATVVNGDVVQVCLHTPGFPPGRQASTEVTIGTGINVPPATFTVTSRDFAVARESAGKHYYFGSLQEAYNRVLDAGNDTIVAKESLAPGALDCAEDQTITLMGGFTDMFDPGTGSFTTVTPQLVISGGTVTLQNIQID